MRKCAYKDPNTGRECTSPFAKPERWNGYCRAHAKMAGLLSQEEIIAPIIKRQETIAANRNKPTKAERRNLDMGRKSSRPTMRTQFSPEQLPEEVYHRIVDDRNFFLDDYVSAYKIRGQKITENIAKQLFTRWSFADVETRMPTTKRLFAKALGFTVMDVEEWQDSDYFNDEMRRLKKKLDVLMLPHITKILGIKSLAGDKSALEQYYDQISKSLTERSDGMFEGVDQDLVDEAIIVSNSYKNRDGIVSVDDEDMDVVEMVKKDV